MILDEDLLKTVDKVVKQLETARSSFAREAIPAALKKNRILALERKHREGYRRKPVRAHEFADWEPEQVWGK